MPNLQIVRVALVLMSSFALSWPAVPNVAASDPPARESRSLPVDRPIRMAYYYPSDQQGEQSLRRNMARLDLVAPHWLTIDDTGTVHARVPASTVPVLRASSAVILPSIALKNHAAGHAIVTDPAVAAVAIENMVASVAVWDGLALDFEGMDATDRVGLSRFIRQLGTALNAAGKRYAIALPAKTADHTTGWSGSYDYRAIADVADYYLVMAYGFATSGSRTPGSTAPIGWVSRSMAYAATEIAPEKLILGIALYGYDWNVTKGPPARALRYDQLEELLAKTGGVPQLDPETGSRTFRYEADGEQHEVWYEDSESIALRLGLVRQYRLGGVGAWRLGQEDPALWPVWDAMLGRLTAGDSPERPSDTVQSGETVPTRKSAQSGESAQTSRLVQSGESAQALRQASVLMARSLLPHPW
jgi:spore germination protein